VALVALSSPAARADENGVSFRVPGFFGSLAATPQQPGWSVTSIYYHTDVNANVAPRADIGFIAPSYVFATPFLGGKAYARASR